MGIIYPAAEKRKGKKKPARYFEDKPPPAQSGWIIKEKKKGPRDAGAAPPRKIKNGRNGSLINARAIFEDRREEFRSGTPDP